MPKTYVPKSSDFTIYYIIVNTKREFREQSRQFQFKIHAKIANKPNKK